jgi:protein TonB
MAVPSLRLSSPSLAKPDPRRIVALSTAIAVHAAVGLALLLPAHPLPVAVEEASAVLVGFVDKVPPPPPPPAPPVPTRAASEPPAKPAAPPQGALTGQAATMPAPWVFDPNAGVSLVVYGERPALDLESYDVPPAELPEYRAGFDPAAIPGFVGADAGGAVTFDVLVDVDGLPVAVVIRRQACSERALETAMSVVGQWRFAPATRGGAPVQAWLEVSLAF